MQRKPRACLLYNSFSTFAEFESSLVIKRWSLTELHCMIWKKKSGKFSIWGQCYSKKKKTTRKTLSHLLSFMMICVRPSAQVLASLTVYSHSCGVTGQLLCSNTVNLVSDLTQLGKIVFWHFSSGVGWFVFEKNQPCVYISTWHDTNMWSTTVGNWAVWEGFAILKDPNGNRAWNPWMPEFCFPSPLVACFSFFLCIGICVITKWPKAFLTRSLF